MSGTLPVPVAFPSLAARRDDQLRSILDHVFNENTRVFVVDFRPAGDRDRQPLAVTPANAFPLSVLSAIGFAVGCVENRQKRVLVNIGLQDHMPAASAVTSIRTTMGHIFFAPEADASISAVSSGCVEDGGIDEGWRFHEASATAKAIDDPGKVRERFL